MARIRVGKDGRTGTIDEKELPLFEKDGWSVVDAPQSGEAEDPSEEDLAANAKRSRADAIYDAGVGFTRGVTLGFDDVVAGGAAAAGDATQAWWDGRPRNPNAYQEGVNERRQSVQASSERSPTATTIGEVGGTLATALLPGGAAVRGKGLLRKVARGAAGGAATGALGGVGFGDADNLGDAAVDAAVGGAGGAIIGGTLGGAAAIPGVVRGGWRGLLGKAKDLDETLSKQSPIIDSLADSVPGVATARRAAKRYGHLLDDAAPPAPVDDAVAVNPKDVVDELPDWLDDVGGSAGKTKVDPRALPLSESAEEIARRKALQSFLLED